jgi:hypothetical protein
MPQRTIQHRGRRSTAVFAALLFAILTMAAAGPHPQDAGRRAAASGALCIGSPSPPAPFCLLCDWAVHSHVVVAVPPVAMASPPAMELTLLHPDTAPTVTLGRRATGRAPPLRFT